MNMKKLLSAFLVFIMTLSITTFLGCNRGDNNDDLLDSSSGETQEDQLNVIDDNYRNWYEVFVRSFFDSNNDGLGDLKGLEEKLDYIKEMGFNGIWLMPICQSNTYHKYDVVDYYTVDREYGTNEDFKSMISKAHSMGINVIVDLVLNHSSSANEWFKKATAALKKGETTGENAKYLEYYNFSTAEKTGYRPVSGTSYYYECRFSDNMPDLNLDSDAVRAEISDIIKFWIEEMGVDGFRLDACTSYYTGNVSKNVSFLNFVNQTVKSFKQDAYIVGEVWEGTDAQIRAYYNSGIDSCFTFTAAQGDGKIRSAFSSLRSKPGEYFVDTLLEYQEVYDIGSMAPFLCNHDTARAGKFLKGDTVKMGAGLLSIMNGNVFVYYGDEIGMTNANDEIDPTKRIAMYWKDGVYKGWTYMPPEGITVNKNSYIYPSVEDQQADSNSILNYYKNAMKIRNKHPEIARGVIEKLESPNGYVGVIKKTWNGKSVIIIINLSDYESFNVDISAYGNNLKLCDSLNVYAKNSLSGSTLTVQPYSITVLR